MVLENLVVFFEARPFQPFLLFVADGRELRIPHPETAQMGRAGQVVFVYHVAGQLEVVDVALVNSLRTMNAVDPVHFVR